MGFQQNGDILVFFLRNFSFICFAIKNSRKKLKKRKFRENCENVAFFSESFRLLETLDTADKVLFIFAQLQSNSQSNLYKGQCTQ